jgi:hypothetical protein
MCVPSGMLCGAKLLTRAEQNNLASLLLLYESRHGYPWFLEDHDFKTAMYGELTLQIGRETRNVGPLYQHRNAKMRPDEKAHISALGRIAFNHKGVLGVTIFPNIFATTPVPFDQWQKCFDVKEFELEYIDTAPRHAKS